METICIRFGESFESDSWGVDVCPNCEQELSRLENEDDMEMEYEDSDGWGSDDD